MRIERSSWDFLIRKQENFYNNQKDFWKNFRDEVNDMNSESKFLNVEIIKSKIHFIPNIVYSRVQSKNKLCMDLFQPQMNRRMPCVIFIAGGGFESSDRSRMPQLRFRLAESGFVVASINYRVLPEGNFPKPIEDVKSAIRFVKAHARELKVDPKQIFLIGDSAGGYLTAFAAVTHDTNLFNVGDHLNQSSKIVAAVDLYGISDLSKYDFTQFQNTNLMKFIELDKIDSTNPLNYITENSAPMLLMHGTIDNIVPPIHTEILFDALKSHGIEVERYLIPNANHSDEYWVQDSVIDLIVDFLKKFLR